MVASAARLEGTVGLGDPWVVTGFTRTGGIVMPAKFRSCEKAAAALVQAPSTHRERRLLPRVIAYDLWPVARDISDSRTSPLLRRS